MTWWHTSNLAVGLSVGLLFLVCHSTATAMGREAQNAINECDALAASPADPDKPAGVPGVYWELLKPEKAIEACEVAIEANPGLSRLHFQLGRAQSALLDPRKVNPYFATAASLGYRIGKIEHAINLAAMGKETEAFRIVEGVASETRGDGPVWPYASATLGDFLLFGIGVDSDPEAAFQQYMMGAKRDDIYSMTATSVSLRFGIGTEVDEIAAESWSKKAQLVDWQRAILYLAEFSRRVHDVRVTKKIKLSSTPIQRYDFSSYYLQMTGFKPEIVAATHLGLSEIYSFDAVRARRDSDRYRGLMDLALGMALAAFFEGHPSAETKVGELYHNYFSSIESLGYPNSYSDEITKMATNGLCDRRETKNDIMKMTIEYVIEIGRFDISTCDDE